jgi:hypothetical protein
MRSKLGQHVQRTALIAALAVPWPASVHGCVHCNIFNYLCPSVRSAPDIVVGTIERDVDDYHTSVRIERILRGTNSPGSMAIFRTHGMKDSTGKRFIFSNPHASPPTFEVLPENMEWEVSYLVRDVPVSTNDWEYENHQSLAAIPATCRP